MAFFLVGCMLYPEMPTTLRPALLDGSLDLFTLAVPLPFGRWGVTELVGGQLLKLVGHPDGELAMVGFRVVMYARIDPAACVYLANLKEVRELTSAQNSRTMTDDEACKHQPSRLELGRCRQSWGARHRVTDAREQFRHCRLQIAAETSRGRPRRVL